MMRSKKHKDDADLKTQNSAENNEPNRDSKMMGNEKNSKKIM